MFKVYKTLLFVFVLTVLSLPAFAQRGASCSYALRTRAGVDILTFTETGWNHQEACQYAAQNCEDELRFRRARGHNRAARCVRLGAGRGGRRGFVSRSCSARLLDRGRIVRTFFGEETGRDSRYVYQRACDKAQRSCLQFARSRGYRGRCMVENRRAPGRRLVTRSCRADFMLRGRGRGRVTRSFVGHGTASDANLAQQRACGQARQSCNQFRRRSRRSGSCVVRQVRATLPRRGHNRRGGRRVIVRPRR